MAKKVQGAWVRDKHPKPKKPVDPIDLLLPTLLFFGCSSTPKTTAAKAKRKKQQQPRLEELEIVAPPKHHQIEVHQPTPHHYPNVQDHFYDRPPPPPLEPYRREPYGREALEEALARQRQRHDPYRTPKASRARFAGERRDRSSWNTHTTPSSAWASAIMPLDV
ncbi:hypothetical protein MMC21_007070 [Puttea exsequens]|nr:hypothetical protein [Puttea exsequens]